ncbi:nucleoside phosphorylase [Brooklawnia cerclae]|uniref:Uridine phosphorylase n=1 Tax=Brooklawnia cerclae TaxID=349934 RepID=A0ABX0SHR2_9ACTN|nr:nucleoside phosphorylase [Brooklawnia cerclae]NIH57496.1 uridine phosphorylase [Brooklawnia cerclae]
MLTPGDWPVLDFDDDPSDLISSQALTPDSVTFPDRAVLAFLGRAVTAHAEAENAPVVEMVGYVTQLFPAYRLTRGGRSAVLIELPVGAPAATIIADYLFQRGVRVAVAVGSCGALHPFGEGEFILPVRALRDEGTSYHYLPPSEWVETDAGVRLACAEAVRGRGHDVAEASVWTTDAFYRETRAMVDRRTTQGCGVVDMECAALAACARFRGVRFGEILFTADSLASDDYDPRDWGVDSHEVALRMAVDAAFGVA